MAKLFFLTFLFPLTLGMMRSTIDNSLNNDLSVDNSEKREQGKAWVVDFKNGLDRVVLRETTIEEYGMLRRKYGYGKSPPQHKQPVVKKDDPAKSYEVTSEEKRAIDKGLRKAMNKFLYAIRDDPDTLLSESGDSGDSYLSIFFLEGTTCLTVTSGQQQWHYVIRPSPLPAWFYEDHKMAGNIEIPEQEKYELFKNLLDLLKRLNSHPV